MSHARSSLGAVVSCVALVACSTDSAGPLFGGAGGDDCPECYYTGTHTTTGGGGATSTTAVGGGGSTSSTGTGGGTTSSTGTGGGTTSTSSSTSTTSTSSSTSTTSTSSTSSSTTTSSSTGTCTPVSAPAQSVPLDMYIMFDQSGSMSAGTPTRWQAVTAGLKTFVQSSTGIGVGLQYFALPAVCPTTCAVDADCGAYGPCFSGFGCLGCSGGTADSCDAADYASPEIEIAPLPGVAQAIINSLDAHTPESGTPTSAALQGAVDHAKAWAGAHPGRETIAVFITDGEPTSCDTNVDNINAIAATGVSGVPSVRTFVIGVGDAAALPSMHGIAAAGGTGSARLLDTTKDVSQQFLNAMGDIRGAATGCVFTAAPGDPSKVSVAYTPGGGGAVELWSRVTSEGACPWGGDGWYYDNNANPKTITLCSSSCSKVSADSQGEVALLTGCQPSP